MARNIRLHSPHAPVPLAKILREEMTRQSTSRERKSGRVKGRGTQAKMLLTYNRPGKMKFLGSILVATMSSQEDGTLIQGKFRPPILLICMGALSLILLTIILLILRLLVTLGGFPVTAIVLMLGLPLLPLVWCVWMFLRSWAYVPKDKEAILAFLRGFADARPIDE